jgi:hypothetical protein
MRIVHSGDRLDICIHGKPMDGDCSECAENLKRNIERAELRGGWCSVHGECPHCRANRIAGDPRVCVGFSNSGKAKP